MSWAEQQQAWLRQRAEGSVSAPSQCPTKTKVGITVNETTQKKYRQRYNSFLKRHGLDAESITPKALQDALLADAKSGTTSVNSWNGLKTCVRAMQKLDGHTEADERLKGLEWPKRAVRDEEGEIVRDENGKAVLEKYPPSKMPMAKRVLEKDCKKLLDAAKDDKPVKAAILIAKHTGMRPEEMHNAMVDVTAGVLFIKGAKKSEELGRGADRYLKLDLSIAKGIHNALRTIQSDKKENIANRVSRLSAKTFPRRVGSKKNPPPTLKSFRHQMGSDLKLKVRQGELTKKEAAYILGHQSTESIDRYGNIKTAGLGGLSPPAIPEMAKDGVEAVREPDLEMRQAVESMTPADKMEMAESGKGAFETARKKITPEKPQNKRENSVARQKPDWGTLDM